MKKELRTRLLEDIQQTGYPLELKVGHILSKHGFPNVEYNLYYLDKDEQKGKEIDLSAYTNAYTKGVCVGLHLVCEVKQAKEKPWVIFSTKRGDLEGGGWLRLHYAREVGSDLLHGDEIEKSSGLEENARIGRSYCEGFKSANEHSQIFKALTSAVKASEDFLRRNQESGENVGIPGHKDLVFVDPMVIVNDLLYEAFLDENAELQLNEIGYIPVSFGYISSEYNRYRYIVEVVTVSSLPDVLARKRRWINELKDLLVQRIAQQK